MTDMVDEDFGDEYKSEDELEDMMTHSIYTDGSLVDNLVVRFNLHK